MCITHTYNILYINMSCGNDEPTRLPSITRQNGWRSTCSSDEGKMGERPVLSALVVFSNRWCCSRSVHTARRRSLQHVLTPEIGVCLPKFSPCKCLAYFLWHVNDYMWDVHVFDKLSDIFPIFGKMSCQCWLLRFRNRGNIWARHIEYAGSHNQRKYATYFRWLCDPTSVLIFITKLHVQNISGCFLKENHRAWYNSLCGKSDTCDNLLPLSSGSLQQSQVSCLTHLVFFEVFKTRHLIKTKESF